MSIRNVTASVAVSDLDASVSWYTILLGEPVGRPMAGVAEWSFPGGGWLQVYALPAYVRRGRRSGRRTARVLRCEVIWTKPAQQPQGLRGT